MKSFLYLVFCLEAVSAEPFAVYRGDVDLKSRAGLVSSWGNLTRIHGEPRVRKVKTPEGMKDIVRFDGTSAVWQAVNVWGRLGGARTVVILARIGSEGVLCDGSTRLGADPIRVKGDGSKWEILKFIRPTGALGGFIVGADVATQNGVKADVAEIRVFRGVLSEKELSLEEERLRQKWGEPVDLPDSEQIQPWKPFEGLQTKLLRKNGQDGVNTYRIPGLATSNKGTLLAVFDLRHDNAGDLPGNIDVGLTRSADDGETWSANQRLIDYDRSGVGDPSILVDQNTGRIFVTALWSKGNRAWHGSGPGITPEETGQFVITHSDDDGRTWSHPMSITPQIKQTEWRLCFNGPGCGIQLRDGTLVMPAQFRDANGTPHSCFIASKDHGVSWTMSPPCAGPTSEAQIAETKDGMLISMRDESRSGQRKWQRWNGETWSKPWWHLPDPVCQASLIRHPDGTLLFSNPANAMSRMGMTVRQSRDDGITWSAGRVIDPRGSMYSCMSVMRDGRIAMVYEGTAGLWFTTFTMEGH
jgi:sialidase-1